MFNNNSRYCQAAENIFYIVATIKLDPIKVNWENLREKLLMEINVFKQNTLDESALLIICALVDETIYNSSQHIIESFEQSFVSYFCRHSQGGEEFFNILNKAYEQQNTNLLHLIYVCLHLGFKGHYMLEEQGSNTLIKIKNDLYHRIYDNSIDPKKIPLYKNYYIKTILILINLIILVFIVTWYKIELEKSNLSKLLYSIELFHKVTPHDLAN
jgi:type VI secretion system protein ImpK